MMAALGLWLWLTLIGSAVTALQCPDGSSECPQNATCCITTTGTWGCCPMPGAVCCADQEHCCPHGTSCDVEHGRCVSPTGDDGPMATKFPAWKSQRGATNQRQQRVPAAALHRVPCPDNSSSCPDGATCCRLPSGPYGCCPLQNAVCCSDGLHCCPQGTTCDLQSSTCTSGGDRTHGVGTPGAPRPQMGMDAMKGTSAAAVKVSASVGDVKCDDEMSCPDGDTCCRLSTGQWGCCPLEQAVCCPDHIHCCPQGYVCDPQGGTCLQGGVRQPWLEKSPAMGGRGGGVRCDDKTSCPDGSTCCRMSGGTWGCCPLEQAVCCKDHQHCCPQGYTCDIAAQSCEKRGTPPPQ